MSRVRVPALEIVAPLLAVAGLGFAALSRTPAAPVRHRIEMSGIGYHPDTVVARVGDTVLWINQDLVPHTATAKAFDTQSIAVGDSASIMVKKAGQFAFACAFHPTMKGTLVAK